MYYQYHAGYSGLDGQREEVVNVKHACGHRVAYEFGGTAEYFAPLRQAWAEAITALRCPTCCQADPLATCPPIVLPCFDAEAGAGEIRTDVAGYEGKPILVLDEPVLVEDYYHAPDGKIISYMYATRLIANAHYVHRREGVVYTPEQEAWVDEYAICHHADRAPGWWERRFKFGASFGHEWRHIEEAERRSGQRIAINSIHKDGRILGEDCDDGNEDLRRMQRESAFDLACEDGQLPGAMPADI